MILEYEAYPDHLSSTNVTWHGRISLDLQYVTSASPQTVWGKHFTSITYVGHVGDRYINVDYEKFCRDWRSVKR